MNPTVKEKLARQARSHLPQARAEDAAPVVEAYDPPPPIPGWPVLWYENRQKMNQHYAFVTSVAGETVNLSILVPDSELLSPLIGVRHVGDPNKLLIDGANVGCWEHAPLTEVLLAAIEDHARLRQDNDSLLDMVSELGKQVTELAKQVTEIKK